MRQLILDNYAARGGEYEGALEIFLNIVGVHVLQDPDDVIDAFEEAFWGEATPEEVVKDYVNDSLSPLVSTVQIVDYIDHERLRKDLLQHFLFEGKYVFRRKKLRELKKDAVGKFTIEKWFVFIDGDGNETSFMPDTHGVFETLSEALDFLKKDPTFPQTYTVDDMYVGAVLRQYPRYVSCINKQYGSLETRAIILHYNTQNALL
jgi:hypothetical protein